MRRYEISDKSWELISDLMPCNGRRGGQWNDHRQTLNGILWILHTGAQWRELPERYGNWKSVYDRFSRWSANGTIDTVLKHLHLKLDLEGRIDVNTWCMDSTIIRASRSAAGALKEKKSQRA